MFIAHGLWRILFRPPYAYMSLKGAFNKEGTVAFQNELMAKAAQLAPDGVSHAVVDLSEFEMSTADSMDEIKQYFAGVTQRGLQHVSYIGANALARQILSQLWQYTTTEISFFDDMNALIEAHPHHSANVQRLVEVSFEHPH
jgi:hypothetical protein